MSANQIGAPVDTEGAWCLALPQSQASGFRSLPKVALADHSSGPVSYYNDVRWFVGLASQVRPQLIGLDAWR